MGFLQNFLGISVLYFFYTNLSLGAGRPWFGSEERNWSDLRHDLSGRNTKHTLLHIHDPYASIDSNSTASQPVCPFGTSRRWGRIKNWLFRTYFCFVGLARYPKLVVKLNLPLQRTQPKRNWLYAHYILLWVLPVPTYLSVGRKSLLL